MRQYLISLSLSPLGLLQMSSPALSSVEQHHVADQRRPRGLMPNAATALLASGLPCFSGAIKLLKQVFKFLINEVCNSQLLNFLQIVLPFSRKHLFLL